MWLYVRLHCLAFFGSGMQGIFGARKCQFTLSEWICIHKCTKKLTLSSLSAHGDSDSDCMKLRKMCKMWHAEMTKNYTRVVQSQSYETVPFIFIEFLKCGDMDIQQHHYINTQENDHYQPLCCSCQILSLKDSKSLSGFLSRKSAIWVWVLESLHMTVFLKCCELTKSQEESMFQARSGPGILLCHPAGWHSSGLRVNSLHCNPSFI